MKKKIILFAAGAVLLAASAITFASVNKSNDPMDDLFKANVEALARNESANYRICYSESVVKVGYTYYDCGTCAKVYDEKGKGQYSKCW